MNNTAKHSLKCNKRDKTILGSVVYRVEKIDNSNWNYPFGSKYDALNCLASLAHPEEYHIIKVTRERVLS